MNVRGICKVVNDFVMTLENMQRDNPLNITNATFHLASSVYVEVEYISTLIPIMTTPIPLPAEVTPTSLPLPDPEAYEGEPREYARALMQRKTDIELEIVCPSAPASVSGSESKSDK